MKTVPLRNILSFQAILLALLPFTITTALFAWWVVPQIRSSIEARQVQLSTTVASQIESHLTAPTIAVKGIAALYSREERITSDIQAILNAQVRASESLRSIYICTPDGRVTAAALSSMNETLRKDLVGLDLSRNSLFLQAIRYDAPVWSDMFLSIVGGGLSVAFAVPADRAVVIGEIDLGLLTAFLKRISTIEDQSIFVIDRRGQVIADQIGRYTAQQLNLSNIPIVKEVLASKTPGIGQFPFEGRTVMGSVANTSLFDWHVLVTLPKAIAYRPLWTTMGILVLTLMLTLLVGVGIAVFSARKLARRFERLADHSRRVATGDRSAQWPQANILEFDDLAEDLQRMAGSIQQREAYNRLLFADSPVPLVVMDPDTFQYLDCNDAAVRLYGYRLRDELVGKQMLDFSAPEQQSGRDAAAALRRHINTCLSVGHAEFEWHHQRSDGDIWYGEINLSQFHHEAQTNVQFSLRDITQRKQAEQALADSEANFRQVTESIREVFWLGSPDWQQIHYISPTYESVWGLSREALYKDPMAWFGAVEAADRPMVQAAIATDIGAMEEIRFPEYRIRRPDNQVRWISARAFPIVDDTGKVYRVAGIAEDITQRKQAEADRQRLELQLRESQKLEAIGTLAGGIAHDFNNILSIIMGYAELCLYQLEDDAEASRLIEEILRASDRAKHLIQQILAFSRRTEVLKKPIRLAPIIQEVATFLKASIPSTIEIRVTIDTEADVVLADATAIHQVLMNLCTNAWQSMRAQGGTLSISLKPATADRESQRSCRDSKNVGCVCIVVTDTGYGIPAENLERIFEPYFSTKQMEQGTGLGLAVVHGIVSDHGGEIRVSSEPGRGTVFNIQLPLHHTHLVGETTEAVPDVPRGSECILVVDDEAALVDIASQMLIRLGYRVMAFDDPLQALDAFKKDDHRFDLVFTDKNMPRLHGFDLAEAVHTIRKDVPVILCTGYDERDDSAKARRLGIADIVIKPINLAALGRAVRDALDRRTAS